MYNKTARKYRLHVPAAFVTTNASPLPLVVDVHGHGGDSGSQEDSSMFVSVADEDEEGFFVLTAEGVAHNHLSVAA